MLSKYFQFLINSGEKGQFYDAIVNERKHGFTLIVLSLPAVANQFLSSGCQSREKTGPP